jgi:hypothetical protein
MVEKKHYHHGKDEKEGLLKDFFTKNFKHQALARPNHRHSSLTAVLLTGQFLTSLGLVAATFLTSNVSVLK